MPKVDIYHEVVKQALIKDGWTITHDPFPLPIGHKRLYVDLGADRLISADKGTHRIAIEIKSFLSASNVHDLELALGQYILYSKILRRIEPSRSLYLAVPQFAFEETFQIDIGTLLLEDQTVQLLVFDIESEVITQWIPFWTNENS